jgi:tetratricopeptide (TPR) repeat protein
MPPAEEILSKSECELGAIMKRDFQNTLQFFSVAILTVSLCLSLSSGASAATSGDVDVIDSFRQHVESLDANANQKKAASKQLDSFAKDSPSDAITEALIKIYPDYALAIDSSEGDDVVKTVALLKPFTQSDDKFLAADASFYLARTLMTDEQFEEALPLLGRLQDDLVDNTVHSSVSDYFAGVAHAGMLDRQSAIDSFVKFLQSSPDAPERLRVSAWRQVQRLQAIKDGKLDDVHQRMDYSRRRLELEQTDEPTQVEQQKIVKMLSKLIKEAEKKECSGSCKNSKKPSSKPSAGKKQAGNNKPQNSKKSQSSKDAKAADGKAIVKTYEDTPASPWSRLRDRSRDPANNAIKEKLPAKYRDLVEKYMEKANGEEAGSK